MVVFGSELEGRVKSVTGIYICGIIFGVLFVLLLVCGVVYQYLLVIETYDITTSKIRTNQKIVLLTDLHGCMHGQKNERLLRMIRKIAPDYICVAGDMTLKSGNYTDAMLALLRKLADNYPIFYAPGNHEIRMPDYEGYKTSLEMMQVRYLENQCIAIGGNVLIYGLDLPEYWYHKCWQKRQMNQEIMQEMLGNCRKDCFTILLAHNPEYFSAYAEWGADLTLSGHIHGGIVRLPRLGGLISPTLQLFPEFDAGLFEKNGHQMVLSRGLGLHHIKLRYFNRPEVSVINLSCQEAEK